MKTIMWMQGFEFYYLFGSSVGVIGNFIRIAGFNSYTIMLYNIHLACYNPQIRSFSRVIEIYFTFTKISWCKFWVIGPPYDLQTPSCDMYCKKEIIARVLLMQIIHLITILESFYYTALVLYHNLILTTWLKKIAGQSVWTHNLKIANQCHTIDHRCLYLPIIQVDRSSIT